MKTILTLTLAALLLVFCHGLAQSAAPQKQAHDAGALQCPQRIGQKVLLPVPHETQIESQMEQRHPHHGHTAQGVDAFKTRRGASACWVQGAWFPQRLQQPAVRAAQGTHFCCLPVGKQKNPEGSGFVLVGRSGIEPLASTV